MSIVKISSKNQVVIPREARETLGVKAGDEVIFVTRQGTVYVLPQRDSLVDALKGRARGKLQYPKNYLKKEHASW